MANERRFLTKDAIINITAKYGIVRPDNVGDVMQHTVESVSAPFDVKTKEGKTVNEFGSEDALLQKKIVTFKAISEFGHRFHKAKLKEAYALELEGKAEEADALYQQYLNGARFSASILSTQPAWTLDIVRNDRMKVDVVNFEDRILRGENIREMAAVKAGSIGNMFTSLFDEDADEETPSTPETQDEVVKGTPVVESEY